MDFTTHDLANIFDTKTIRSRSKSIYQLALKGETNFKINLDLMPKVCDFVLEVIRDNYPNLDIPFHSRWGHFKVGGVDRLTPFYEKIKSLDPMEQGRIKIDLVLTSVLLDAGSGPSWSFLEKETKQTYSRSEGLAIASWHMFLNGDFSSDMKTPFMADADGLESFTEKILKKGFQVTKENPLIGTEGRAGLIQTLGKALKANPEIFKGGRPGSMLDYFKENFADFGCA